MRLRERKKKGWRSCKVRTRIGSDKLESSDRGSARSAMLKTGWRMKSLLSSNLSPRRVPTEKLKLPLTRLKNSKRIDRSEDKRESRRSAKL